MQPYQPSLAAAWLFQRSMALKPGQLREPRRRRGAVSGFLPPTHINTLLAANFRVMQVGCLLVLVMVSDQDIQPFPCALLGMRCCLCVRASLDLLRAESVLQMLGDRVMRPFLQDTIQFWPLSAAMTGTLFIAPLTILRVLVQVSSLAVTCTFHCSPLMLRKLLH